MLLCWSRRFGRFEWRGGGREGEREGWEDRDLVDCSLERRGRC